MMPGVNPKQMKAAMRKMGMTMEEIENVEKVVVYTPQGNYVFENVQVVGIKMQGQTSYQLTGDVRFEEAEVQIPEDDVKLVASQTGKSAEEAEAALKESKGDIAEAIMKLSA
ncbi:MAG TPA: nascent polypeptide-associated complex protein [Methanocorpusculum sp.]|nr:nascent polypeptide-associated complex protein [Candidatus Methanocorpusculum equi]MCQ2358122.1 nascent polypeptide-associated complex protein [Methanocorpusculum sp.]HJJ33214.1 nascent polypeptide-associated complex protein [Methanocorpusculum sp.]HJJ44897.1 nascent polypeptide-associated complex protein [Methanocorpusculum sp.]